MEEEKTKIKKDLFGVARGQKVNSKNRGITLVALVITIVVLIILAAVAINLSLGNNGIFNRAKTAKEQYSNATQYEQEVVQSTSEIDNHVGGNRDSKDTVEILNVNYDELFESYTKYLGKNMIHIQKNGKMIIYNMATGNGTTGTLLPSGVWTTLGVLKEEYRPIIDISTCGPNGSSTAIVMWQFLADGTVKAYQNTGSTQMSTVQAVYNIK